MFFKKGQDVSAEPEQAQQQGEFPKKGASHNGDTIGYTVEVRYSYHQPQMVAGMLLGKEWQRLSVEKAMPPFGVPISAPWNSAIFGMLGLYDYPAAQALRWWFHANAHAGSLGAICLESRIVAHRVRYSMSEEPVSERLEYGQAAAGSGQEGCLR